MEKYRNAEHLLDNCPCERPVLGYRPHAAMRASRWFLDNFPGRVLYAVKANDAPHMLGTLSDSGICNFDVASTKELESVAALEGANAHAMNPVKSRAFIRRAYFEHGVRTFSLDSESELEKILEETGQARDLTLFVRFACNSAFSEIPLEDKFGISWHEATELLRRTRQAAERLGLTFNVGSQAMSPEAYGHALHTTSQHIVHAGVVADVIDIGGGFPSVYPDLEAPALSSYIDEINEVFHHIAVGWHCELWAEPGRALVAEAESLIVRVDARRGDTLYINDGSFGVLYDAAHLDFVFPCRRIGDGDREGNQTALSPFSLYGPTCDSADYMKGPFYLPADIAEGDFIEFGNLGAYGRVMAAKFNGCGHYDEVELADEPMLTAYGQPFVMAEQASSASETA